MEIRGAHKLGSSCPLCLSVSGRQLSRDPAARQQPCPAGGNGLAPLILRRGSRLQEHPHGMAEREV